MDSFNPPRPSPVLVQVKSVSEVDQMWIRVEYGNLGGREGSCDRFRMSLECILKYRYKLIPHTPDRQAGTDR